MSRSRRLSWSVPMAIVAVVTIAGTAWAAVTFAYFPPSHGVIKPWTWSNGDPSIGGGSNGNLSAIVVSDTQGTACFSSAHSGPQLQVFYSKVASGGTAWSPLKNLSGNTSSADRGVLVTQGSNVYTAWSTQQQYYSACPTSGSYNFDVSQPRINFFRRSTDNGTTWGAPIKLPGQSATFRGDYMYMAASGTNVYITTTDVATGKILLWISTNSGSSFANPINVGTAKTTNVDNTPGQTSGNCPCGYTGGFTGLPAIATDGTAIGIAYTATSAGAEKILICNTSGTGCTSTQVASSGAADNYGYSQAAGDSSRMVFTWTTGGGAFSDVWSGGTSGSFGGVKTITTFPDTNFTGTACGTGTAGTSANCAQAGTGAIPVLIGTTGVGVSLTECNTVGGVACDESQSLQKSREILVWYESSNNGTSYGTHALIKAPTGTSKNPSWMSEYGSVTNVNGTIYVLWNGHDDVYGSYDVEVKKCTGC